MTVDIDKYLRRCVPLLRSAHVSAFFRCGVTNDGVLYSHGCRRTFRSCVVSGETISRGCSITEAHGNGCTGKESIPRGRFVSKYDTTQRVSIQFLAGFRFAEIFTRYSCAKDFA